MHTGAIGYYTSMAAAEGLAGIGIVAGVPNMAYEGARGAGVATSPLAIELPASKNPDFVLDMATRRRPSRSARSLSTRPAASCCPRAWP